MRYGIDFSGNTCYITSYENGKVTEQEKVICTKENEARKGLLEQYNEELVIAVVEKKNSSLAMEIKDLDFVDICTKEEAMVQYFSHQPSMDWSKDVGIFEFQKDVLWFYGMKKRKNRIYTERKERKVPQEILGKEKEKDRFFSNCASEILNYRTVSTIYLTGECFEGSWMQSSKNILCRGRRVFMGGSLFSTGAVLGAEKPQEPLAELITQDDGIYGFGLRASQKGKMNVYIPIIEPGTCWYETSGEVTVYAETIKELVLEGKNHLQKNDVRIKLPLEWKKQTKLPKSKIKIRIAYVDSRIIEITAEDLGFGRMAEGKGMIYKNQFKLP